MGIKAGEDTFYQAKRGIVQDGLVFNLDSAVNSSYSGGTNWTDIERRNVGVLQNGATFSKDHGGVISFDGTDDYLDVNPLDLNLSSIGVTISFWFKGSDPRSILRLQRNSQHSIYIVPVWHTNYAFIQSGNGTSSSVYAPAALRDGNWRNYVCVYEKNNFWGNYLDGSVVTTSTAYSSDLPASDFTSTQMFRWWGGSEYTNGTVSGGLIYNRALTAAEVLQNYNATRHRFGV